MLSPVGAGTEAERLTCDAAWQAALVDAETALARAQESLGLVPPGTAAAVASAAASVVMGELAVRARDAGNPVVPLAADLRAATAHAHHGATSQDIMDTAAMLVASRTRAAVLRDLDRILAALAALADRHRATAMCGRTLLQQAAPTTFGLAAAGWLAACLDARDRLAAAVLPVQLGGAAGTLAGYGPGALALLGRFASETGLAEPDLPWHTRRTPVLDLAAALAALGAALGKTATDVVLHAQDEVGELSEPAAPGRGGSSAMAHKRNPVLSTMIRSAAIQVPGLVQTLHTAAVAPLERPAGEWQAEWEPFRQLLRLTGGAAATAADLLEGLTVHADRMAAHLDALLARTGGDPGTGAAGALIDRALDRLPTDH